MTTVALVVAASLAVGSAAAITVGEATVERGDLGIPRIVAESDYDAMYAVGWVHAQDRLFQMDFTRRLGSGTLSELVGSAALPQDIQLRNLGLRRAAEASWAVQSDELKLWLQAYTDGVNAYLADTSMPLPPEYGALELTRASIPEWTVIDCLTVAKVLAFNLSFGLEDIDYTIALLTMQAAGEIVGFDGTAMFFEDLYRTAPFDPSVSIPGFEPIIKAETSGTGFEVPDYLDGDVLELLKGYRSKVADVPILKRALERDAEKQGSNWWVAAPSITDSGYPILANDPHLSLDTPSVFYEVQIEVVSPGEPMKVFGVSFPGTPSVAQGCTPTLCWGSTVHPMDVTDVYVERVVLSSSDFLPIATAFDGGYEIIRRIKQRYMVNTIGDGTPDNLVDAGVPNDQGGTTFIVPRRNNGPIVDIDSSDLFNVTAISVQYTGWGPTREFDAFRMWARAETVDDFEDGLQYFDVGSQNWVVADTAGNIAYFTSAENPIREDLQTMMAPDGDVPPYLLRDGTHHLHHEWMPVANPQPGQALPYEILPASEMPHLVNPESGYILNCNNDPIGTSLDNNPLNQLRPGGGLYYLSEGYASGFRMGRLQRLFDGALAGGNKVSMDDLMAFQANNQLLDAEYFAPQIVAMYGAAESLGQIPPTFNANLGAAVGYLAAWDFSTPTGIPEGYDPGDDPASLPQPDQAEIDASIAATIYAAWRGQMVQLVVDAPLDAMGIGSVAPGSNQAMTALRNIFENFPHAGGVGASGFPFIQDGNIVGTTLFALSNALDLLESEAFAPAFGGSTDLDDYRWGYLHRIVFDHPLGGPFSLPPGGGLASVSPDLPGVARSGGFGALDASSHSARADGLNEFMFGSGPARRFVGHLTPSGVEVHQTTPGGVSGVPGSPHQSDALMLWLTNHYLERFLD
jgi:penicillin amidase